MRLALILQVAMVVAIAGPARTCRPRLSPLTHADQDGPAAVIPRRRRRGAPLRPAGPTMDSSLGRRPRPLVLPDVAHGVEHLVGRRRATDE